ncbi:serine/arginine repetitive matrix protein 1-like [Hemicordylus capensis]|uniref:serine/arginine repetitive matrix protein 1-like n=1 Tax=Hemicordylus capensis TaxID=884348 RepID=UPI002302125F|nr:serine/arginine repetitive matrix protein 1-like [Hemicordylus capensis]
MTRAERIRATRLSRRACGTQCDLLPCGEDCAGYTTALIRVQSERDGLARPARENPDRERTEGPAVGPPRLLQKVSARQPAWRAHLQGGLRRRRRAPIQRQGILLRSPPPRCSGPSCCADDLKRPPRSLLSPATGRADRSARQGAASSALPRLRRRQGHVGSGGAGHGSIQPSLHPSRRGPPGPSFASPPARPGCPASSSSFSPARPRFPSGSPPARGRSLAWRSLPQLRRLPLALPAAPPLEAPAPPRLARSLARLGGVGGSAGAAVAPGNSPPPSQSCSEGGGRRRRASRAPRRWRRTREPKRMASPAACPPQPPGRCCGTREEPTAFPALRPATGIGMQSVPPESKERLPSAGGLDPKTTKKWESTVSVEILLESCSQGTKAVCSPSLLLGGTFSEFSVTRMINRHKCEHTCLQI